MELKATPIPIEEAQEIMLDDAVALLCNDIHAAEKDPWAILFAALDAAIEAHKP